MSDKFTALTPDLYRYLVRCGARQDEVLARLAEETAALPMGLMQVAPEEGALLTLLVKTLRAKNAVEVGTFTGYSSLCIARGLPPDGRLLALDVSEEWTATARRYWKEAGVAGKIDLKLAPALETLRSLPEEERFEFAFIDADKVNYAAYYEEILKRLRRGGLVVVDNVLWGGSVIDQEDRKDSTLAIRDFNARIADDRRVDLVMLPVSDGITIARKR